MSIIIKDIKRNSREIIRIEISEFKGQELINLRTWYSIIDNNSGDIIYKPTQKGITLNIKEFEHLRDGIDKLSAYINDKINGKTPEQFEESKIAESGTNEDEDVEDEIEDKEIDD